MAEENYFDDFNRRRPRRSTYRGSYRRPGSSQFFDPSADILAGIESVEKTIGQRKKTVKDFENAAAIRRQEMIQSLEDTESMDDMSAVDSLQSSLMQQVDDLYKLDIESFEGDRSAYLNKANEVNRIVQTIPALMGLIDAEATALDEAKTSGKPLDKSVLRSNNPDYYNFVENAGKGGKDISFRIQNGNIIAQLDGKDVFNGNAYVKAKEKGVDLINYAKDYTKQMDEFDTRASRGLEGLVKASKIEQALANGTIVETNEKNDYINAVNAYKKALLEDPNIGALVNESTYQTFGEDDSIYRGEANQVEAAKNKIVDYMVNRKFPMYNKKLGTAIADEKITRDVGAPMTQYQMAQYKNSQRKMALAEKEFKYEMALDAANKAEFEGGIDFYLNRNLKHAKDMRAAGLFDEDKIKTEKAADKIAKLLSEGSAFSYKAVKNKDGDYVVQDAAGEVVTGANTPVGLVDLLNQGTIYAQLNADDASKAAKYVGSRMPDLSKKSNITYDVSSFSLPQAQGGGSVIELTDEEKIKNAKTGDEITLSSGIVIRKK